MINIKWLLIIMTMISGCHKTTHIHHKQKLSKSELLEHTRSYVNEPNFLFRDAKLPGGIKYKTFNDEGITVVNEQNEYLFILPTDLFFKTDSDQLAQEKFHVLEHLVDVCNAFGNSPIIITGHTDNIGSREQKSIKSKKLAKRIKSYLWKSNIPQQRIITSGLADTRPISDQTSKGNYLNRRVTVHLRKPV